MVEAHSRYYFSAFIHLSVCLYFTKSSLFSIYSFKLQKLKDRIIPKVTHRLLQLLTTLSPQLPFLSNTTSNPLKKKTLFTLSLADIQDLWSPVTKPTVNTLVQTNNIS